MPIRPVRLAAFALLAGLAFAPAHAPAARAEDPPLPGAGGGALPDGDPVEIEKRKRIELDNRRRDLAPEALPAMEILDRFRNKDFRVWGSLREEVVAQGKAAIPAVLIALEETDWETRAFAASCLADLGDKTAAARIGDAYDREKYGEARRQFILAISALEVPSAEDILVRALDDEEVGVRLAAMNGLGLIASRSLADTFRKFVKDPDPDLRYSARGNLAELGDDAEIASLVAEAYTHVGERRLEAADSLVLADNSDRWSQYLLGLALARTDDRRAVKVVEDAMTGEKPWDAKDFLRMGAAIGVGRRAARTGTLPAKLLSGMTDKDGSVRIACTYGAGFIRSPELVPRLLKALSDSQMDVRYNAVTALGRIGDDASADGLRKALSDHADEVRVGAVRALGMVRKPSATKALLGAVRDEKYMIRVLAARQLESRTSEDGVLDALRRAASDADYGVREAALAALAHHKDGAAVRPQIAAALDDSDFGVQANALLALAKIAPTTPAVTQDESAARRAVLLYLRASQRKLIRAGEEFLDAARPPGAVLPLIEGLGSDVEETRKRALTALVKVSEQGSLGFDPAGPKGERDAAVRKWREWWESKKTLPPRGSRIRAAVTGTLVDQAKDLKWKGLDIALLFDSTYSMAGLLNAAKERIDELAEELHELLPSVRVSVYTYRDHGDNYLFYGTPLTFDIWKIQGFLQYASPGQGGDLPEAVYEVVKNCAETLQWRPRAHKVIVYAGDATHHREQDAAFMTFIRSWFTKDAQATLHALYTDTNRRSLDIKARKKRDDASARFPVFETYQRTATAGRGKAVKLDDESGLMKELLVLTFGDEWRADIENLMDFER